MITIVSGFQRCGSSLLCQMLHAGGMRVFHDEGMGYPSFETYLQMTRATDPSWLNAIDGQAVKWLEPQHTMPANVDHELRIVWMRRNHHQQAKSAVKFLGRVGGFSIPTTAARQMERSYDRDEPSAIMAWRRRGHLLIVTFESLLSDPSWAARTVQRFLDVPLNVDRMATQVRPRDASCLPGFLELDLLADSK